MEKLLTINQICKKFAGHTALSGVSLSLDKGDVYGLLGPNGAGKTTLIRIINRIVLPDRGECLWRGAPLSDKNIAEIGYLPEERGLYKKMTVEEQIVYLARLKGLDRHTAIKQMNYWLDKFELIKWKKRPLAQLSKGMQQKVQFITTVIHDPQLIILDEPFSGFDPVNMTLIQDEIALMKEQNKTVLLSTHNMESVEALCENISLIDSGVVLLEGNVGTIKEANKLNLVELIFRQSECDLQDFLTEFTNKISKIEAHRMGCRVVLNFEPDESLEELILKVWGFNKSLVAFRELFPSLNEVFIQNVKRRE
ncbi:MAG: ABC transporter ATP-binding protein [Bacteroidota bacterium]